jgi:hypothetical protein
MSGSNNDINILQQRHQRLAVLVDLLQAC